MFSVCVSPVATKKKCFYFGQRWLGKLKRGTSKIFEHGGQKEEQGTGLQRTCYIGSTDSGFEYCCTSCFLTKILLVICSTLVKCYSKMNSEKLVVLKAEPWNSVTVSMIVGQVYSVFTSFLNDENKTKLN